MIELMLFHAIFLIVGLASTIALLVGSKLYIAALYSYTHLPLAAWLSVIIYKEIKGE